jgi:hypothetical protein
MNDLSVGPGMQATMALQFVERDGRPKRPAPGEAALQRLR